MKTRTETDSLGALEVPRDALYGAQTQRAINNFAISGRAMPPAMPGSSSFCVPTSI